MDESGFKLPIRLVPRKGSQILRLAFFGFFLGFSIFWMVGAAGLLNLNDDGIQGREAGIFRFFPLFGLPFTCIGIAGMTQSVLKMRRGSPYYHLEISSAGLSIRSLFKQRRFAWRELPPFETIEVVRHSKSGKRLEYFTVATETLAPPVNARQGSTYQREVVRIFADEYGAKNGKQDADALTAWFNQLRGMAAEQHLDAGQSIEVPEGFRVTAISIGAATGTAHVGRPAPVTDQTQKRDERPPTVQRR